MTEAKSVQRTDQTWWNERFLVRYPEAGPPLFRRRSNVYRRRSMRVEQPFPPELVEQLAATGESDPARLHALFLAGLAALLQRYTGSAEAAGIVVGSPPPGEPAEPPQVLPLLVDVTPETSFAGVIDAATDSIAEGYRHADCSIDALLDTLGMGEVTNRHPLFPVVLCVSGYHPDIPDVRNDVTVIVSPDRSLVLEYNANVHDQTSIARFGRHLTTFLARGLAEPGREVRSVDYLTADERAQLLGVWSRGESRPQDERCLHELVEAAVRAHPDREALVLEDQAISYGELDARANRLANHLVGRGAGVGSRVGLCVPASPDMLIGTLAILKTGAAVVPVVPTFPASRNMMTVEDSAMDLVVTVTSLSDHFAEPGPEQVCIDRQAQEIGRAPATAPNSGASPDDVAYILFTSGSTGRPKGVPMRHRTVANLVHWQRARGIDPASRRTLQRTSIGFDVSFQEIFSTWAFGGSLVVATDDVRDDVSLLPETIERYGITRLFLPPVALDQMAVTANLTQRTLPTLDEVIVAGEQLLISMPIRRLFHQLDCTLDNQYGPTETHVVTAYRMAGASTRWAEAPPIGKPVDNVNVYLLDPWLAPVPAGVPGEIHVGGVAPASGYLDQEQTAERFLDDPINPGRMYRTGDRARLLADGNIEFLGRADDQVKIRGYRIELGDIEAHLLRVPGIRNAAVAVHETQALGKQLAAYLVTENGRPDATHIRRLLLEDLPGHMVPATSSIIYLDALPTTPTGKVDRRALPAPPRAASTGGAVGVEGDTEQTVAKLWAQALEMERVGRDDDFIALGGHSLIGIQVVAQLNELFSVTLPLRTLLRGTTVAALAAEIDRLRAATHSGTSTVDAPSESAAGESVLHELTLPDERRIVCLQPAETRYLHLDVFEHRTYERGGIRFPETGCVFDVGAHIGLFTLYALDRSPRLDVFAFEPCPPLFEALRRNTEELPTVRRFPFGLSDRRDTARLTFYPNLTGMSSFHPDRGQERALLSGILENLEAIDENRASSLLAGSEEYLAERLLASTFDCERRTLSDVLAETGVERVDLLKIDVQKAELEVLRGIADQDWPKIEQLAVELHDLDGQLNAIRTLLTDRGYRVSVEQDSLHTDTAVHFVYAVRA